MKAEPDNSNKLPLLRIAFKDLDEQELQEIAALTEFHTYPPGHVLCREGEPGDVFYIVADGDFVVSKKIGDEGDERLLRNGGRGDLVGEMALIQNAPRSATVRTTSACTMLEMKKGDFETILSQSPQMAIAIIRITLDRMRENDRIAIDELLKTNKVLRQLDRNKLEFIQVTAHELRTPLTVIKGYANLLNTFADIKTDRQRGDVVDGIIKGTDRMTQVVNLMLDVTRLDAETLTIRPATVPIKWVINDVLSGLNKGIAERRIGINTRYAVDTPDIKADPDLVYKALHHLIVNAIKYTPDGGNVEISTRPVEMQDHALGLEIAIRDSGIGLDSEHHELVFEKFYQVGSVAIHSSGETSFKGGGPGLGLAIVRGVARAHGGKAWVESKGHDEVNFPGSTFYLQLPVNPRA
jgi:signal transduction histidine kinase